MTTSPILKLALWTTDVVMALLPRKTPSEDALNRCKIISHRGAHDNLTVFENTMEAFRIAHQAGAWGLEMDVRWTRDLIPVVHHDTDTSRVFGTKIIISDVDFKTLREKVPQVPSLEEFIAEFGGSSHLMIELKGEEFPDLKRQALILKQHLSGLEPFEQYHILALEMDLFEKFEIEPKQVCLPVATLNAKELSQIALERGYAGLSGHFLMLTNIMKDKHEDEGQLIGTGFPTSKNALYRELNRGVEYIFTNHPVELLEILKK